MRMSDGRLLDDENTKRVRGSVVLVGAAVAFRTSRTAEEELCSNRVLFMVYFISLETITSLTLLSDQSTFVPEVDR